MSGSFERLKYDTETYNIDIAQSTAPLNWRIDPNYANKCDMCRPGDVGYVATNGVSLHNERPLTDIESELYRLNYKNSRNPMDKYIPGKGPDNGALGHFEPCRIATEYSRNANPISTSRGVGLNRFQPICLNPQDIGRWEIPEETGIINRFGVSNRLVIKDSHVPCVPKPIDQTPALPVCGVNPNQKVCKRPQFAGMQTC